MYFLWPGTLTPGNVSYKNKNNGTREYICIYHNCSLWQDTRCPSKEKWIKSMLYGHLKEEIRAMPEFRDFSQDVDE